MTEPGRLSHPADPQFRCRTLDEERTEPMVCEGCGAFVSHAEVETHTLFHRAVGVVIRVTSQIEEEKDGPEQR